MGNTITRTRDDTDLIVDLGRSTPFGVYPNAIQDWDQNVVSRLISDRKLSPFYKGLNNADDIPDLANFSSLQPNESNTSSATTQRIPKRSPGLLERGASSPNVSVHRDASIESQSSNADGFARGFGRRASQNFSSLGTLYARNKRSNSVPHSATNACDTLTIQSLYEYPIECPICFLYYPANINYTRCCDQPICTECFLQMRRSGPNYDPTACPYCVESNFGVIYNHPASTNHQLKLVENNPTLQKATQMPDQEIHEVQESDTTKKKESLETKGKRRQSISHTAADVVTSDDIRQEWMRRHHEQQMNRVVNGQRRITLPLLNASTRRGRHLLITSSNSPELAFRENWADINHRSSSIRNPIRDRANHEYGLNLLDVEELMYLEAIRRSLAEMPPTATSPATAVHHNASSEVSQPPSNSSFDDGGPESDEHAAGA